MQSYIKSLVVVLVAVLAIPFITACSGSKKDVKAAASDKTGMQAVYDAVYNPADLSDKKKTEIAVKACSIAAKKIAEKEKKDGNWAVIGIKKELFANVEQKDATKLGWMMKRRGNEEFSAVYITTPVEAVFTLETDGKKTMHYMCAKARYFVHKNEKDYSVEWDDVTSKIVEDQAKR